MNYGKGDATYQAMGGFLGITELVDKFYTLMDSEKPFAPISKMHTENDVLKREKLSYFLCGWSGGEETYTKQFGRAISIPGVHAHLVIGNEERDAWMNCMAAAMKQQGYSEALQSYLYEALSFPANKVVEVSEIMQRLNKKREL